MLIVENQTVLLGPPGCGKTTTILDMVENDLKTVAPERIALISFTKKAVEEAIDRVCIRFKLPRTRFSLFRTAHSMCYRQLGCNRNDLMTRENFAELGDILGYALNAQINPEDGALILPDNDKGAKLLFLDNMARTMCRTVKETWRQLSVDIPWIEVERFSNAYAKYKKLSGKMDFTDLLQRYIDEGAPLDIDVGYIDEAQDLSKIQWAAMVKCFANAKKVVIAGDDDQSIFKWSGADLDTFLSLQGQRVVLGHSYRLPAAVHAKAQAVVKRVKRRFQKEYTPASEGGTVSYVNGLDMVRVSNKESTMILVRNVYLLKKVYEFLSTRGINFTGRNGYSSVNDEHVKAILVWETLRKGDVLTLEQAKLVYSFLRVGPVLARGGKTALNDIERSDDVFGWETLRDYYGLLEMPIWHKALEGIPREKKEYYITLLKQGVKLTAVTNVHVNTIHGVKGGEAQHVVVITDMSRKTFEEMSRDPCSEHRVFYVAVTRAKEKLTIVLPQSSYSYSI